MARSIINLFQHNALIPMSIFRGYKNWLEMDGSKLSTCHYILLKDRSSRSQIFLKISVLTNFVNFTGKYLCWSFFLTSFFTLFNFRSSYLQVYYKESPAQVFFCDNSEFSKNSSNGCFWKGHYWIEIILLSLIRIFLFDQNFLTCYGKLFHKYHPCRHRT